MIPWKVVGSNDRDYFLNNSGLFLVTCTIRCNFLWNQLGGWVRAALWILGRWNIQPPPLFKVVVFLCSTLISSLTCFKPPFFFVQNVDIIVFKRVPFAIEFTCWVCCSVLWHPLFPRCTGHSPLPWTAIIIPLSLCSGVLPFCSPPFY